MNNRYDSLKGNAGQVPGAFMCGCISRMPVVPEAACTKVTDDTLVADIIYSSSTGAFSVVFTHGTIEYSDCGDLNAYYKTLVGTRTATTRTTSIQGS